MSDLHPPSLVEQVTQTLLKRLSQKEWTVGARLPGQNSLAAELGVSVVVVREALARLKADGLVDSRQGAGVFVRATPEAPRGFRVGPPIDGDPARLAAALEVRASIEVAAAQLAAMRRTPEDIDDCTQAFKQLRAALAQGGDAIEEDFHFHLAIAKASHNEFYPELLRYLHHVLMLAIRAARAQTRSMPRRLEQVQDEHAAILQAIVDGVPSTAGRLMHAHLANSARRLDLQPPGGDVVALEPTATRPLAHDGLQSGYPIS